MLFLIFAFLVAFGRDYSHSQETLEEKAGSCSSNFVVGTLWIHFFEPSATSLPHCNFEATPFGRYNLSTTSDFHDGFCKQSEPVLEMFSVQTHGKGTCAETGCRWRCETRRPRFATQSSDAFILNACAHCLALQMIFFSSPPQGSDDFCKVVRKQLVTQLNCGNHASCKEPRNTTRCSFYRGGRNKN